MTFALLVSLATALVSGFAHAGAFEDWIMTVYTSPTTPESVRQAYASIAQYPRLSRLSSLIFWTPMPIALLLLVAGLSQAADAPPLQRYLESLKLGDRLEHVKIIYPPTRDWSRSREPFGGVDRILIQRGQAKYLPDAVESFTLDFKRGRLVRLEVLYARDYSKKKPLERVVEDVSLQYGEPRRSGDSYFWWDASTVMVAAQTTLPDPKGRGEELRTTLAVMDRSQFAPLR